MDGFALGVRLRNIPLCFSLYCSHSSLNLAQNNPFQELCLWKQGIQWELL